MSAFFQSKSSHFIVFIVIISIVCDVSPRYRMINSSRHCGGVCYMTFLSVSHPVY